jgi:hypothetical protein
MDNRPWALVAPWYRWSKPGDPATGRFSRPSFQKYDSPDLVNEFLKDPQKSLKFVAEDVWRRPGQLTLNPPRKIFLETHKRFYLVVCELHCDGPGFPNAQHAEVMESGFVVRRRVATVPERLRPLVAETMTTLKKSQAGLAITQTIGGFPVRDEFDQFRLKAQMNYYTQLAKLDSAGIGLSLEGWIPGEFKGFGDWAAVEEMPATIGEHIFPMYPLKPDPRIDNHSGAGRAIYFGMLPAGSADSDPLGRSRFDSESLYEVRCFVRRRKGNCPGEYVWSARSESYRLAPHMDLTGTSHRPVTIQMPDLPALKAEAEALPPGAGAPLRMVSPEASKLDFKVDASNLKIASKGPAIGAICSFSIPLITIVASFVLQLFLPIVIFVFQLFFLLKLKFCIPPSFSLDAGVVADLNAALEANIGISAELDVKVDAAFTANFALDASMLGDFRASTSAEERASLAADQAVDFSASVGLPPAPNTAPADLPPFTANLEYEARVEVSA